MADTMKPSNPNQGVKQMQETNLNDDDLSAIQQNAMESVQMLCTTFVGILQAFQRQADKKSDLERQINEMKYDLESATDQMKKTTKSMQSTVDTVSANLKQQNEETDHKLQEMRDEMNQSVAAVKEQSIKTQGEIYNKMEVTESRMNSTISNMEAITDRIESKLGSMESQHETLKSEITGMARDVRDNLESLQNGVQESQQEIKNNLQTMSEKFQSLRFEVDSLASSKADVKDLKWKVGMDEYSEYKLYLDAALSEIREESNRRNEEHEEIMNKTGSVLGELTEGLTDIKQRHAEEVKEIHEMHRVDVIEVREQINAAKSALDQLLNMKDVEDADVIEMVYELRENMQTLADRIPRKKDIIPPGPSDDPSCTTMSGNCWSCGMPFKPKLKFSSKITAGGGFNPRPPSHDKPKRSKSARLTTTDEYITELIANDTAENYGAMRVAVPKPLHKGHFKRSQSFCPSKARYRPTTAHL